MPWQKVHPLRWQVLRPGLPPEAAYFPGDEDRETLHFAALTEEGEVVGVASYFSEVYEPLYQGTRMYRLRGMATHPDWQRQAGIGTLLLRRSLSFLKAQGIEVVWCYARIEAVAFYQKNGFQRWEAAGQIDIPGVGLHEVWYIPLKADEKNIASYRAQSLQ
ncbi:MAG: GNAT family N-acetyltransferase [Bacteroidia bacterium]|nr:GNAT family N-acetyltransferase [Bacteroidia bacterium]MDW8235683.1 GNAT family N-acetyltransferase [Bacteroidia bacterium]